MSPCLALCRRRPRLHQPLEAISVSYCLSAVSSLNTAHIKNNHTQSLPMQVRPAIKLNNSVRYFSRHSSSPPNNSKNHKHDHTADPCWSCGYVEPDPMFCNSCGKLQSFLATVKPYEKDNKHKDSTSPPTVSPPPVSYFDLLSQPKTVEVCAASLEAEYRSLQKVLHPDKYANACGRERDISLANSSIVNQAYQVTYIFNVECYKHPYIFLAAAVLV